MVAASDRDGVIFSLSAGNRGDGPEGRAPLDFEEFLWATGNKPLCEAFFHNFWESFRFPGGFGFPWLLLWVMLSLICLPLALYVPVNSIWGFIHCISHREAHILPIIGRIKLIQWPSLR